MKLILSSNDFSRPDTRRCIFDHLGMPASECRLLYIPNEKVSAKQMRNGRFQEKCASFGFQPSNVTVMDYYRAEQFGNRSFDALYLGGGNTFSTYARIVGHGFADLIRAWVENGAVYVGGSCGAHVAGTDLRHVLAFDENRAGLTDFKALGLFRGRLVCHYSEERRPVYETLVRESPDPVYALRNGDSIVIEDGSVTFYPAWETVSQEGGEEGQ